ncbi:MULTISPECIES: glycosyltransferase family 4 protein [unclassified Rhizobium]|uniref:glycosyltransferase family 4 protein n=1 Tax=unclassified Rhizobium TaxID=2613769 RepID=UPI000ABD6106|nr:MULTISPECIES: glycosyltransferase family 1 protein [unclassified Rhizobium]
MARTIVIDGFNLDLEKGTGIATYARNLSYEVHSLGHNVEVLYGTRGAPSRNPLIQEIAFFDANVGNPTWWTKFKREIQSVTGAPFGIYAKEVPISGAVIATQFRSKMPYFDKIWNGPSIFTAAENHFKAHKALMKVRGISHADIMHWTYPLPIYVPGAKNIYTLHDLVPLRLPFTTLDKKRYYFNLMRKIVRTADHIVTVSETSRRDIIDLLGCPEDKITNTFQSVDIPDKYALKSDDAVQREVEGAFGLPYKDYYLFYGSIEPKKNIGRIIEAYLASKVKGPLVIVGAQAWKSEQELRMIKEATNRYMETVDNVTFYRDRIRLFDYAPFPLLVSLIKGAKALVFPSLYEGFGLPVLEAMSLGTPVITSSGGSIPEVAGQAALMVDPYDTKQITDAIIEIDTNAELRARLSEAGPKQAALFSSERYRERLQQVYDRVL